MMVDVEGLKCTVKADAHWVSNRVGSGVLVIWYRGSAVLATERALFKDITAHHALYHNCCCAALLPVSLVQNDMDALEQIQGMPPGMYHRYGVLDDMDDDEDEEGTSEHIGEFNGNSAYNADMLVAGMAGLGVNDSAEASEQPGGAEGGAVGSEDSAAGQGVGGISNWSLLAHPGEEGVVGMDSQGLRTPSGPKNAV